MEYQTNKFFARNHGGTYHLVDDLLKYNLITDVKGTWYITSKLAEELIAIELCDEKINSVL